MPPFRRWALGSAAVALAILPLYLLRLNAVVGLMVDDAWYIVLAKALSEGAGFRLISSATTPIQPLYPPGFPAILSVVYRLDPEFPRNVWLLKGVSIAAMMGVGLLTYAYLNGCRRLSRELAVCVAIAVTITPAFVFFATSTVMSECVFALCQLGALLVLHRSGDASSDRSGRNLAVLAAVLAAAAMLVRSAAVAIILAGLIWFAKERLWRRAVWFGAVAALCILPWILYSRVNAPTASQRTEHGGAVAYEYLDQLSMRWAGAPRLGRITARELPKRISTNFTDIFGRSVGGILVPTMFRDASESGEEALSLVPTTGFAVPGMGNLRETMLVSAVLSMIAFIGFVQTVRERLTVAEVFIPIALGIIMVWPFWSFRFVVPLTPLLLFYFTRGIHALVPRAAGIVLLTVIGLHLYDHAGYIVHARSMGRVGWVEQARDVDALLEWIQRGGLADDGLLVTTNPGLVYLRTGRKSLASDHPLLEWPTWKQRGVRYVAVLYPLELPSGQIQSSVSLAWASLGRRVVTPARRLVYASGLLAATLAIYVGRLNSAAGLMVDDGWYILLAKSLAQGTGYRMISSPTPDVVPLYPAGFPALLSLVFHVSPEFPQNVWLLKCVSIAAMFGVGLLTYAYARIRHLSRELAALVAAAVTVTPAFVFLATSTVMSECVYTLVQLATIVMIHRSVEAHAANRARVFTVAASLTAAGSVLIRSAGLGLVLASGVWLVKERLWRRAAVFGAVAALCILPWMLYARAHAPTAAEQALHGGSIVYSYGEQIWMRWAGDPASGTATLREIPARIGANIVDVFARGMGGIFLPVLLRGPAESGEEMVALGGAAGLGYGSMGGASVTMAISVVLSGVVLLGFVQSVRTRITVTEILIPVVLGIIVVWPFWTFRFLVPLAPFLAFYLVTGIRALASARAARVALLCMIGLHISDHARYLLALRDAEAAARISWLVQARETEDVLAWVADHAGEGLIATTNPALVYLRTGHKTVSFDRAREAWSVWKARGVRYVVCLVAVELPTGSLGDFRLRYRSSSGFWVIEI